MRNLFILMILSLLVASCKKCPVKSDGCVFYMPEGFDVTIKYKSAISGDIIDVSDKQFTIIDIENPNTQSSIDPVGNQINFIANVGCREIDITKLEVRDRTSRFVDTLTFVGEYKGTSKPEIYLLSKNNLTIERREIITDQVGSKSLSYGIILHK